MTNFEKHCWCEISIDSIIHNYNTIKNYALLPIIATVKADAYGHNSPFISKIYQDLDVLALSVASLDEALELRKNNIKKPILILGYTQSAFAQKLSENNLTQNVFSLEYAKALNENANEVIDCHIKLDTGMARLGFDVINDKENAFKDLLALKQFKNLNFTGVFTHFASADSSDDYDIKYTDMQITLFNEAVEFLKANDFCFTYIHGQNSGGIARGLNNNFNAIRPGCILYGYPPSDTVPFDNIIPALKLKSIITHIKPVKKGSHIGYSLAYTANEDITLATICCGYADGLPRALSSKDHHVEINGKLFKVVGRICMDQIMVDITNGENIKIGDEVIVLGGKGEASIESVAKKLNTTCGSITCGINKREARVFTKEGKIKEIKSFL